jgi:hypothetical protein
MRQRTVEVLVAQLLRLQVGAGCAAARAVRKRARVRTRARAQSPEDGDADGDAEALTDDFLADHARRGAHTATRARARRPVRARRLGTIDARLDAHAEWMHAAAERPFRLPLFAALAEQVRARVV